MLAFRGGSICFLKTIARLPANPLKQIECGMGDLPLAGFRF